MKLDISKLKNNQLDKIDINMTYSFNKEELNKAGLLKLDNIQIKGYISKTYDDYQININLKGEMIIPCTICLKEITHKFNLDIEGYVNDLLDDIDQNIKKEANTIDIFPIIWENILVEKPTRAIHKSCEKIIICGDGWTFDNKLN